MPINIGSTLNSFTLLAGTAINNTGASAILGRPFTGGNVGTSPGAVITGFPPGTATGSFHFADGFATTAQIELLTLYNTLTSSTTTQDLSGQDLGGMVLTPGVYNFSGVATQNGVLTLNGSFQLKPVYVFKIGSTFTIANGSSVLMTNGTTGCQVFWQVTTDTFIGTGVSFNGALVTNGNITFGTGSANSCGSLWTQSGMITLNTNLISWNLPPQCACTGGDPHCVCLDGSRIDVYEPGFYRLFQMDNAIINAEVKRNEKHVDYYHQVWVKINNDEYLLEFTNKKIKINDDLLDKWEQTRGAFTFLCEAKHNTVGLTMNSNSAIYCNGLFAGQIIPLRNIKDDSTYLVKHIKPNYYQKNALHSGSTWPHVMTTMGKNTKVQDRSKPFRLLQWNTFESKGVINAQTNENGLLKSLYLNDGKITRFDWENYQNNHWALVCKKDGKIVNRNNIYGYVYEREIKIGPDSIIFIRVQSNASVSVGFRNIDKTVRGLLIGDQIVCGDITETKFRYIGGEVEGADIKKTIGRNLYEQMIEQHMIPVN
jgi:hypothetical protein